jgi:hypothetical protein
VGLLTAFSDVAVVDYNDLDFQERRVVDRNGVSLMKTGALFLALAVLGLVAAPSIKSAHAGPGDSSSNQQGNSGKTSKTGPTSKKQ